jgi:hypothetical protein
MKHHPTPAHSRDATLHHTLHQLAPCELSTTMKKLSLTKPIILHEKKTLIIIIDQGTMLQFNYLHNSYHLTPIRDKKNLLG